MVDQRSSNQALEHLRRADPPLGVLLDRVGPYRPQLARFATTFQALSHAIVYQQLSGKAAASIYARVAAAFGDGTHPKAAAVAAATPQDLREAGLSRAKAGYIQALAIAHRQRKLPSLAALNQMDDEAVIENLSQAKGVGRWTAQMLLLAWLRRPDVLPAEDLGIRKGFQIAFASEALPEPAAILAHGVCWRPWRSVASWYLWRANEL